MPIFREPTLDDIRHKGRAGRDPRTGRYRSNDPTKRSGGSWGRQPHYKHIKKCVQCGREFAAARSNALTCSPSCRGKKFNAERKRMVNETLPEAAERFLQWIEQRSPAAAHDIKVLKFDHGSSAAMLALKAVEAILRWGKSTQKRTADTADGTEDRRDTGDTRSILKRLTSR